MIIKRTLATLLPIIICFLTLMPNRAFAETLTSHETYFSVEGMDYVVNIDTFETEYRNDLYLSLNGIAALLKNTEKCFYFNYSDGWNIVTGEPCWWDNYGEYYEYQLYNTIQTININVDGRQRKYSGYEYEDNLFLSLTDIELMLDLYITYEEDHYTVHPSEHFHANLERLRELGYLDYVGGALLGDLDTGEIYFAHNAKNPVSLASTSKLMTFYILAEKLEAGEVSLTDSVPISAKVERVCHTSSGMENLCAGEYVVLDDLMHAMLIESSNECTLAIAEYLAGSEADFVELMNQKAQELGLMSAKFYDCYGVSVAIIEEVPIKVENKMTVMDMFKFVKMIIDRFPWILEITSQKSAWLDSMYSTANTTNRLLYNMDNAIGLKTGTTPMAGYNLIAVIKTEVNGEEHKIVSLVFQAMDDTERYRISELLLKSKAWEKQTEVQN